MAAPLLPTSLDRLTTNGILTCDASAEILGIPSQTLRQRAQTLQPLNTTQTVDAFVSAQKKPKKGFLNTLKNVAVTAAFVTAGYFGLNKITKGKVDIKKLFDKIKLPKISISFK